MVTRSASRADIHPGSPDESFAEQGVMQVPSADEQEVIFRSWCTVLPDGGFLLAGALAPTPRFQLRRITSQGEADESFGPGGVIEVPELPSLSVSDGILQDNGNSIVCGDSDYGVTLARFTYDGALDPSFGSGGIVHAPPRDEDVGALVGRMVELPSGALLVQSRGKSGSLLRRFTGNGQLDASFGEQGVVFLGATMLTGPMVIVADRMYVSGFIGSKAVVAKYDFEGRLDTSFGVDGHFTFTDPDPRHQADFPALTVQKDGKLVAGGQTGVVNGAMDGLIVRISPAGELDATFNDGQPLVIGLRVESIRILDIVIEEDGRILATSDGPIPSSPVLFRLESNGAVDRNFGDPNVDGSPGRRGWTYVARPWLATYARIFGLVLAPDHAVFAIGHFITTLPWIRMFVAKHHVGPG
ncbi:MAG: hypothetical protein ACTHOL_05090 [Luteibacter jiangsuensis]